MPSKHNGTLSVVGVVVKGSFFYDNQTHVFEGTLDRPSDIDFPNVSAVLMLGGDSLKAGPLDFAGDFGTGGIVIAMDSIPATINVQLPHDIAPYKINGVGEWIID